MNHETIPMFDDIESVSNGPIEILGRRFPDDTERRAYFTERLREKLQDPAFRQTEGFPHGTDEDILALSDPPYYTACPNPFIDEFIQYYGRPYDPSDIYHRDPYSADVSEGKNDPIYNAHSYHTKVPHRAIMRYLIHYTNPGDIILDGFGGTGMTGVAARLCANPDSEFRMQIEKEWSESGGNAPAWGARRTILGDLSPAATFIAYNYNMAVDTSSIEKESKRVLDEMRAECGWMYETKHTDGKLGFINYTVWSDVFSCPNCSKEVVFFNVAMNDDGGVSDNFECPNCQFKMTKRSLDRVTETVYDHALGQTITRAKQIPVLINYSIGNTRFNKKPDEGDLDVIAKIDALDIPYWFPIVRIDKDIDLWYERDYRALGVYAIHHFFTKRNLYIISSLWQKVKLIEDIALRSKIMFAVTGMLVNLSRMNRYRPNVSFPYNPLSGTLYIGSLPMESNVLDGVTKKVQRLIKAFPNYFEPRNIITTQSCSNLERIPANSIDYIFTDPPFGSNIIYSDLNIIWESWLRISTEVDEEAVVHRRKQQEPHTLGDYSRFMLSGFREYFRVLKPGRWMTVEFSNTRAAVWNIIQLALEQAGFVVANVAALDKQQGSFKAVTTPTAVRQDLVISCYKPNGGLEERFLESGGSQTGVWEFIRTHLGYLPVFVGSNNQAQEIVERTPRILYDRLVAYFVQHGYPVPLSSQEFQAGLAQRFPERDGMYFLREQVVEYERKRMSVREVQQLQLFVFDESSAILWIRQQLANKPQTTSELTPQFMQELRGWQKYEVQLELAQLLEQNFLQYNGNGPIPAQIVAWMKKSAELRPIVTEMGQEGPDGILITEHPRLLREAQDRWYVPDPNKASDLEKVRLKGLLREWNTYVTSKGKLKQFRTEAIRAGFKQAWNDRDYATIVQVAERLPESVLQEDPDLLMYYDNASLRV